MKYPVFSNHVTRSVGISLIFGKGQLQILEGIHLHNQTMSKTSQASHYHRSLLVAVPVM